MIAKTFRGFRALFREVTAGKAVTQEQDGCFRRKIITATIPLRAHSLAQLFGQRRQD
jgi:hypothetical protein